MSNLKEHFRSLTGDDLVKFIQERLGQYKFFEENHSITVVIPMFASTGRWAVERAGLLTILEGSEDCHDLKAVRHSFLGIFGELVTIEFAVRGLYRPSVKVATGGIVPTEPPEVVEYEFSKEGVKKVTKGKLV